MEQEMQNANVDPQLDPENEVIIEGWEDEDEVIPYQYSITSYGADYPVESLVTRLGRDDIWIPPFQRDYVWNQRDASRFIESLLLGLPVPGIFLSREPKSQTFLVIDGQQRLKSLEFFYDGVFEPNGREFSLIDVQPQYLGKTYKTLSDQDRRKLDNSIIHLTIIQQEEPSDDDSSIYHIFERLNTTGRILSPQEIRACLYHGDFSKYLGILNDNENWRELFGAKNKRLRDQELILRFFALFFMGHKYEKPMKGFLNKFMAKNREFSMYSKEELKKAFVPTIELILESIGKFAFKPKNAFNAAVFDAIMVGIAKRLEIKPIIDVNGVKEVYFKLMQNPEFRLAWETATTDEENVNKRINMSIQAFSKIK